jgi:Uncharacterized BCR, YaiI/YqxD family COG1671
MIDPMKRKSRLTKASPQRVSSWVIAATVAGSAAGTAAAAAARAVRMSGMRDLLDGRYHAPPSSGGQAGATAFGPNGRAFTAASIGGAIATRAIMADLRAGAGVTGGPAPFAKADRSRFLQALDAALVRLGN